MKHRQSFTQRCRLLLAGGLIFSMVPPWALAQKPVDSPSDAPAGVVLRKAERNAAGNEPGRRLEAMEFKAFGRQFELRLESNDRLKTGLDPSRQARLSDIRLYSGFLSGYQGSWVRIADNAGDLTGAVWDGAEIYIIETRDGALLVQRANDFTESDIAGLAGDIVSRAITSDGSEKSFSVDTSHKLSLPADPGRTIEVGIVADEAFVGARGPDAEADVLAVMNVVDGIFLWQLGVQISIAELALLDGVSDPFSDANYNAFLDTLSDYKTASPTLASLGLVHLFTGHDIIDDDPAKSLIGVAHLGTVCDASLGIAITEGLSSFSSLTFVAAHEIAHNFGAPHDNQAGSPCESAPNGFLMQSSLNDSLTFSQCSIDEMLPYVKSASCFDDWLPNDLSVRVVDASDDILYPDDGFLVVALDTNGLGTGNAVELLVESTASLAITSVSELDLPGVGFECDDLTVATRCTVNYLPESATVELRIGLSAIAREDGAVTVTVSGGNDPNPDNDSVTYEFLLAPTVDLQTEAQVLPGQSRVANDEVFHPADRIEFSASVTNRESDTATNVKAEFFFNELERDYQVASPGIACGQGSKPASILCELGELPGGEERQFDVSFVAPSALAENSAGQSFGFSFIVNADERDSDNTNDDAAVSVYVASSIFDLESQAGAPAVLTVGTPAEVDVTLTNLGPDPAPLVEWRTRTVSAPPDELEFLSVSSNVGTCGIGFNNDISCSVDVLEAGQSMHVAIEFLANGEFEYALGTDSAAFGYEINADDNAPDVRLVAQAANEPQPATVTAPTPAPAPAPEVSSSSGSGATGSTAGGGGGALDWISMLALLGVTVIGRGRSRLWPERQDRDG